MSSISAFFLACFHFLALVWATIHPDVNPHRNTAFRSLAREVRVDYQQRTSQKRPLAAPRRAPDTGYWHTSGSRILDDRGNTVRIQGVNWYGFETVRKVPGGLTSQDYRSILETIRRSGFNTVRIPLSNDMVEHPIVPEAISFSNDRGPINQSLRGLNSLQILDRVVEHAGQIGLKVILDNHRSEAGDSAEASGLWYTADYPEQAWIADWQLLARRYAGNATVIGVDLRNEPHNANSGGACWSGCGSTRDWHAAAMRGGNAVLGINPRLIVFVEGTDAVNNDFYWWGGNLEGVRKAPVSLDTPNQLVYSAHDYGPNEYHQKWFDGATQASLENVWTRHWGYISREGIAPVWVGEFGTSNKTQDITGSLAPGSLASGSQAQWFQALLTYLGKNSDISWTSWALNGEDANGLLDSDYDATSNPLKLAALNKLIQTPGSQPVNAQPVAPLYVQPGAVRYGNTQMALAYRPHLPSSVLRFDDENNQGTLSHQQQTLPTQHNKSAGVDGF
jgi:endoglucanase